MKKDQNLTFYKSELAQYYYILKDDKIKEIISSFLLKYVTTESFYKKLLVAYKERDGKRLSEKEKSHLSVTAIEVAKVLEYYDMEFEYGLIERIFGSNDKNYMECSIKKLRDRLVHRVNENVLRVIIERYDNINNDLNEFIALFNI